METPLINVKRARIVIGASFGDEGKGLITDYLCSQGAGVVVRFNGGAQAGHTVVTPEGERHVFHHFGSGSLCEVPTFLSQFFVCNPILFFKELEELRALGFRPQVFAHPHCLVTTFADMLINQDRENSRGARRHGSCGVGFHETIVRSQMDELKITMADLWNGGKRLESQLAELCGNYAKYCTGHTYNGDEAIPVFLECCKQFAEYVNPAGIGQCQEPVFEGAQGLLLDQNNKQFFPHVTHSNTGMKNVGILCQQGGFDHKEIYYVSRTYLTRHGAGLLPGEDPRMSYPDDTNHKNPFQGQLRFAPQDVKSLKARCAQDAKGSHTIVLTHCDQLEAQFDAGLYSYGPCRSDVTTQKAAFA